MPTNPDLDRKFPGIDPDGKHCEVDMEFAQRILRLQGAASACRDVNKMVLDSFLDAYTQRRGRIGALAVCVKGTCKDIQVTEHAAKVCLDRTASLALEKSAAYISKNDPDIRKLDQILTAMEQVAGLRGGSLNPNTINVYNQLHPRIPLYPELNTGAAAKRQAPETFDVNFQNFDNIARQNYYVNPNNWGFKANPQIPKEPTDSLTLAACMRRYAGGTAANALTSLFAPTELNNLKACDTANRATLVIVDGKTVSERMQEIYNGLPDSRPGFEEWCAENLKQKLIEEDQIRKFNRPRDDENFNEHAFEEKFNKLETKMKNIYNGLGDTPKKPSYDQWRTDNMWTLFKTVADPELLQTMTTKMENGYNNAPKKTPYIEWYAKNLDQMSSEIVASGLMAGKRVEAFVPGPDGKLPDQPTVLHRTGYQPTPEKPVTLNAWERFFNKFGFYKEKAAQAKEHQELLAARERLKANYTAVQHNRLGGTNDAVKEMFFGEFLRQNNIPNLAELDKLTASGSHFRPARSAASSACICLLAAQGHDIRDILDPSKLQTEKRAAGAEYMRNAFMDPATGQPGVDRAHRIGNDRWLGDVFYRGQQALMRQVNNIMADVDLSNPVHRQTVLPMVCATVGTMFDSFQEATYSSATSQVYIGYLQAAHAEAARTNNPAGGDLLANNLTKDINRVSFFFSKLEQADKARADLTNPHIPAYNIPSAVSALVTEQVVLAQVDPATNRPFTDRLPPCEGNGAIERAIRENGTINNVASRIANRRGNWKEDADMILSGEFARSISVKYDVHPGTTPQVDTTDYLRTAPDGSHFVEQIPTISQRLEATINVAVSSSMSKKLGNQAAQANRAAPIR